jgi:hypothetical protein
MFRILEFSCHVINVKIKISPNIPSNKYGKKEPQSFSHCGSFDHRNLQSLNDCKSIFLVLRLQF